MSGDSTRDRVKHQLADHLERLQGEGMWGLSVPAAGPPPEPAAPPANGVSENPVPGDVQPVAPGTAAPRADASLRPVEAEALACVACRLHETRTKVVFGVGSANARLMFIGEGPGRDEDLKGEPFVGPAGQLLTKIIRAMGYEREEVYIANAVKCRPPHNRDPHADEVAACRHFLMRQVALIEPEIIVLLGRSAIGTVLDLHSPLSRLRGSFREWNGTKVMCTYHPAYLLRNPSAKGMVWDDMKMVRAALDATAAD